MSKYTTEVRFICEEAAGLDASVGYNDVNRIVETAYPKIFDSSLVFYDEETKTRLLPKILLHYYQREIGFETVGLWKLKLNQKLREILPYYNQLYASEKLVYDPLKNVDNFHDHHGEYVDNSKVDNIRDHTNTETRDLKTVDDGSSSFDRTEDTTLRHSKTTTRGDNVTKHNDDKTIHGQDTKTHSITGNRELWNMFSDTPQGGIDGVSLAGGVGNAGTLADNAYLTNATHETEKPAATQDTTQYGDVTRQFGNITNEFGDVTETYNKDGDKVDHVHANGWEKTDNINTHTGTVTDIGKITDDNKRKDDGSDEYVNHEYGKIGVMTYQEMQMKWRETFLNIDMQIIDELGDLFMKVW